MNLLVVERRQVDAAHVTVDPDHGFDTGGQMQVGGALSNAKSQQLGDIHRSFWRKAGEMGPAETLSATLGTPQPTEPPLPMSDLTARLESVRARVRSAALAAGRAPDSVRLLAVSKTFPAADIAALARLGQHDFGESYLQEAVPKIGALADLGLRWHFIGPIQSNKTREIAAHFDWVHGIDRIKIAERLSAQRPEERGPLQVCVQVNISGEVSKSGCAPDEAPGLCAAVCAIPGLRLRGLMAIPAPSPEAGGARAPYARLRDLFDSIKSAAQHPSMADFDTLSAGMSDDLEAAIAEGSTLVRIGSALFGERDYSH
jgi:pyridoxal phosphate enzyme (YggS family)